jgi:lipopolysaccharide/colanic/teichoic acid biosynthesis glycosyltransferase
MIEDRITNSHNIYISGSKFYWASKRFFDIFISILLLPAIVIISLILLILNNHLNPGPIFFIQSRMGKNCKSFNAIKFRSMLNIDVIQRSYNDPIEQNRITPLGKILRNFRIDELPQIINVLKGDMSLIGPRPDYYEHALVFADRVRGYRSRHIIRPGISGLSQIRLGYAVGVTATRNKAVIDRFYIENAGFKLDTKIVFGTILTVLKGSVDD